MLPTALQQLGINNIVLEQQGDHQQFVPVYHGLRRGERYVNVPEWRLV